MTSDWDKYAGFHRTSAEETGQESLKEFWDGRMKTSRLIWKASHYIIIIIAAEGQCLSETVLKGKATGFDAILK